MIISIVIYSTKTEVGKFSTTTVSDLQVGNSVMVIGKSNEDGSITAQSIQIRPLTNFVSSTGRQF